MADTEYTPLDFQISDDELEQLPPLALRLIIRKLLDHIARQDQRIRESENEASQLKAKLDQNYICVVPRPLDHATRGTDPSEPILCYIDSTITYEIASEFALSVTPLRFKLRE